MLKGLRLNWTNIFGQNSADWNEDLRTFIASTFHILIEVTFFGIECSNLLSSLGLIPTSLNGDEVPLI